MDVDSAPAPRVELRLPPDARAPATARRSVEGVVLDLDPEARETVQLLVSELVTNSVRHGRLSLTEWIDLCVETTPRAVRVSVSDPGVGFRRPDAPPRPGEPSGWGLYLLEQMSDRWGVKTNHRTVVWFEIERDEPTRANPGRSTRRTPR